MPSQPCWTKPYCCTSQAEPGSLWFSTVSSVCSACFNSDVNLKNNSSMWSYSGGNWWLGSVWQIPDLHESSSVIQWSRACHLKSQSQRPNRTSWPLIIPHGKDCIVIDHSAWMPFIHLSPYWWCAPGKVIFSLHFSTQSCLAGGSVKIFDRSEMQVLTLIWRLCSINLTVSHGSKVLYMYMIWNKGIRGLFMLWPGDLNIANVYFEL